ncbi:MULTISPECIES: FKBP-type peptidyl-prolyl cis-trans isomerase [unclassified Pseudomonas]|uniref:FKBP-type peptidyl-prolyl cis-trans isomerase n=1 Tax=unclassified Pseudomonas TaxID=196821 RepID=UPI00119C3AAD|nr:MULTISPECIES: FKBP-type peptidyl-prolyl cis-trans isomerase [unclassified Pseudomonas]TWC12201.1 FKBP-type peptidyl-prolyl cis-trans isomerase FklB [Pseudomonas sp. SJZ074]TWC17418.1 FKBP-type peptidyl-prolyl cis-trans isomerase FklB [Pseudomonas sp. SJZ075]TWC30785.1 FKBP-type peptidyl-prolyl cis-trans isomerase FklB [Pseudomonas sp. SJZ085]TWC33825.1 FKBP-type peptidyl-prolyl cis-trans isomerase FklB [Pseudomonas sp. SJZ078]TWC54777.1 FKBP-type peptidyl-prolyl cis-trans isomerase FklB [Ps
MSRHLFFLLCMVCSTVQAVEKTSASDAHDLAYSLGASLGERLRQDVPDLQIQALVEGLQQAYLGKPLALKDERIEQILAKHQAQLTAQSTTPQIEVALKTEQKFLNEERNRPGVKQLEDGILLTELKPGHGAKAGPHGKVQVLYTGRLPDGSVFDANRQAQWFNLDSVIDGWRSALPQMPVGAKWRLVIPSTQAYGAEGAGDVIPPFTPLVFEIELLGVTS